MATIPLEELPDWWDIDPCLETTSRWIFGAFIPLVLALVVWTGSTITHGIFHLCSTATPEEEEEEQQQGRKKTIGRLLVLTTVSFLLLGLVMHFIALTYWTRTCVVQIYADIEEHIVEALHFLPAYWILLVVVILQFVGAMVTALFIYLAPERDDGEDTSEEKDEVLSMVDEGREVPSPLAALR